VKHKERNIGTEGEGTKEKRGEEAEGGKEGNTESGGERRDEERDGQKDRGTE
jgi:hypothetical protein